MMKFLCTKCNQVFDHEGIKEEFNSAIYGPCFKYVAYCPACETVCDEYRNPSASKSNNNAPCGSGKRCSCCG
jgi:hypothetical protein